MKEIFKNKIVQFFLILLSITIIFSLVFPSTNISRGLRGGFIFLTNPISNFFRSNSSESWGNISSFFRISQIKNQNENLKSENIILKSENAKLEEVKNENRILRDQLDLKEEKGNFDLIASDVVGVGVDDFNEIIVINKGKKDGVRKNSAVISEQFLIGRVINIYPNSSQVQLITSVDSIVNGLIQESRAKGIVKGEIGYGLKMESITKKAEVREGQTVITSGLGGGFPKGLIIGYVDEVLSSQGDIFSSANLVNPINFNDLEIVFVIKND